MKKFSARRVAVALLAVSLLSLIITFVATSSFVCSGVQSCLAAAALGSVENLNSPLNLGVSQTTPQTVSPADFAFYPHGVQLVSIYALILALAGLVFMEFYKRRSPRALPKSPKYSH